MGNEETCEIQGIWLIFIYGITSMIGHCGVESVHSMERAGVPDHFYTWLINTGTLNTGAVHLRCRPLSGSSTANEDIVPMSECVHLCLLIYRLRYPTLPADALKGQALPCDFNAANSV